MSSWETPVRNYTGPPIPDARKSPPQEITLEGTARVGDWIGLPALWRVLFPWEFPGEGLRPPAPMKKGSPQPPPQTASTGPLDAARKAVGIDTDSWQKFIQQTLADVGVYAGLGVLGLLGLVFLVSAGGSGSPLVILEKTRREYQKVKGTRSRATGRLYETRRK